MRFSTSLNYPIVAIADLHGQRRELERLVGKLEKRSEWPDFALVFLGDFVDRGPNVRGTVDLVRELLRRPPGGSAIMGNHDLALVRAARLDGGPPSPYWIEHYRTGYDCHPTFESYLGRAAMTWGIPGGRTWMPCEGRSPTSTGTSWPPCPGSSSRRGTSSSIAA